MTTERLVHPHWLLSILVAIFFFPIGVVPLVFSFLCADAQNKQNEINAARYSSYVVTASFIIFSLAILTFFWAALT